MSLSSALDAPAAKAPPIVVTAISVAGVSLQDWVYIVTLLWLGIQIAHSTYKWWKGRAKNDS